MEYDVAEMVERFVEKRHDPYKRLTVKNLFYLNPKRKYSFLSLCTQTSGTERDKDDLEVAIADAIRDSIQNYSSNKKTAIDLYKAFVSFLSDRYRLVVDVNLPTVAIWDPLERQLAIMKMLHEQGLSSEGLADRLLVSERTIEEDLKVIRGNGTEPLQFMEQPIKIPCKRARRTIKFESTAHPIFLVSNLAQVITILEGLGKQAQLKEYEQYALSTAVVIWSELSDYAKKRIGKLSSTLNLDQKWLMKIQSSVDSGDRIFRTEDECSSDDTIMRLVKLDKSGEICHITYEDEEGHPSYLNNVRIISINRKDFTYEQDGVKGTMCKEKVIEITTHPLDLES